MGNVQGGGATNGRPSDREWQLVSRTPSFSLLRNINSQLECEKYDRLYAVQSEYIKEQQTYSQRQQEPADNVVRISKVESVAEKELCTTFYRLAVFVEHLPYTIDKIENMSFRHALYVLMEVLTATRYLLKLYPSFVVDQSKVFLTRDGRIKVWISDNPVENEPRESLLYSQEDVQGESDLVQIIFDIVESRTIPSQIPLDFIKAVRFSKMNLDEAISHIKVYCFDHKLRLAKSLEDCISRDCPSERCQTRLTNYSTGPFADHNNLHSTFHGSKPIQSVLGSAAQEFRDRPKTRTTNQLSAPLAGVGCQFLRH